MATIQEIIDKNRPVTEIISDLKEKAVYVQPWTGRWGLIHEYDPKRHPVMNKAKYPDIVNEDGSIDYAWAYLPSASINPITTGSRKSPKCWRQSTSGTASTA